MFCVSRNEDFHAKLSGLEAAPYAMRIVAQELSKTSAVWVITQEDDFRRLRESADAKVRERLRKYEADNRKILRRKGVFVFPIYPS